MEMNMISIFTLITPLVPFITAITTLLVIYPLISYAARKTHIFCNLHLGSHLGLVISNSVYYGCLLLLIATLLNTVGVNISAILGAAGVIGIAIGFAAQTTISNVISGVFLILERPFSVGDELECEGTIGTIERIDPLSVKLRTKKNQLVRIPNETLIKKSFVNHSFYPIQRIDIIFKSRDVALEQIRQRIRELIDRQEGILQDPAPKLFVNQVTSLSTKFILQCWTKKEDHSRIRRQLIEQYAQSLRDLSPNISIE